MVENLNSTSWQLHKDPRWGRPDSPGWRRILDDTREASPWNSIWSLWKSGSRLGDSEQHLPEFLTESWGVPNMKQVESVWQMGVAGQFNVQDYSVQLKRGGAPPHSEVVGCHLVCLPENWTRYPDVIWTGMSMTPPNRKEPFVLVALCPWTSCCCSFKT